MRGLKGRLEAAKGNLSDALPHILWVYQTMPYSTTNETPFRLTCGNKFVTLVRVEELSWRTIHPLTKKDNVEAIREEVDFL